jgi:hypothetical protein
MGTLGDRIGRRLLLIGAAVFSVGSLLAAFDQRRAADRQPRCWGWSGDPGPSKLSLTFHMLQDPK